MALAEPALVASMANPAVVEGDVEGLGDYDVEGL